MPRFNPDNLNIHELAVEEPEKQVELPFDPGRDITPEDWQMVEDKIHENKDILWELSEEFAKAKILGHDMKVSKDLLREMMKIRSSSGNNPEWSLWKKTAFLKILGGDTRNPSILIMNKDREKKNWYSHCLTASYRAIATGEIPNYTDEEINEIIRVSVERPFSREWEFYAYCCYISILGIKPNFSKKDWQDLNDYRENRKKESGLFAFLNLCFESAVISADEVVIPEGGGLELIRHKKENLKPEAPTMPEQKQF